MRHCKTWPNGVPPPFFASKMNDLSAKLSHFLGRGVSQTGFICGWFDVELCQGWCPIFGRCCKKDDIQPLMEETAEENDQDMVADVCPLTPSSESLSPLHQDDSPHHGRAKIDRWTRHSEAPQNTNAASSSRPHVSMVQRAHTFEDRMASHANALPESSRCICRGDEFAKDKIGAAVRNCLANMRWGPHLFQSGQWSGQIRLLCFQFRHNENSRRLCFESVPVPDDMRTFSNSKKPVAKESQRLLKAAAGDQKAENRLGCTKQTITCKKNWKMFRSVLQPRCIESQVFNKFWIPFGCTERTAPLDLSECHLQGRLQSCTPLVAPVRWWKSFLHVILRDKFLKNNAGGKIKKINKNPQFSAVSGDGETGGVCACVYYIYIITYICM